MGLVVAPRLLLVSADVWILHWLNYYSLGYVNLVEAGAAARNNTVVVDFNHSKSVVKTVEGLHAVQPFTACITCKEFTSALTHVLAKHLNLPYQSCENYKVISNKLYMRQLLESRGVSQLPFMAVSDTDELKTFVKKHGRAIVKPLTGYGSQSVFSVNCADDSRLKALPDEHYLVEKYVDGREFSIEAFSCDGQHLILGVTQKLLAKDSFIEQAQIFPAELLDEERLLFEQSVTQYLDALGFRNGPSHTEIKYHDGKVNLIETHNRPGGDFIPQLIEMSTGFNLFKALVEWAGLSQFETSALEYSRDTVASYYLFAEQDGVVESYSHPDALRWQPCLKEIAIYPSAGQRVSKTHDSFSRIGHIIVSGKSATECIEKAVKIEEELNIVIRH